MAGGRRRGRRRTRERVTETVLQAMGLPRRTTRHPRLPSFGPRTLPPHHRDGTRLSSANHSHPFCSFLGHVNRVPSRSPPSNQTPRRFPSISRAFASATATTLAVRPAVHCITSYTAASSRLSCGIIAVCPFIKRHSTVCMHAVDYSYSHLLSPRRGASHISPQRLKCAIEAPSGCRTAIWGTELHAGGPKASAWSNFETTLG